jgi:hypothetical protein
MSRKSTYRPNGAHPRGDLCNDYAGLLNICPELLAIRAGTLEPFEEASTEVLERIAGVRVSGSKIHDLCKAAGDAAAALAAEGALGQGAAAEARRARPVMRKAHGNFTGELTTSFKTRPEKGPRAASTTSDFRRVARRSSQVVEQRGLRPQPNDQSSMRPPPNHPPGTDRTQ